MAVQVEGYCAVQVGAVEVGSGVLQALENFWFGKTERGSVAERDYCEAWLDGREDFWSGGGGTAVMSYLQEVGVGMVQAGDAALDGFLGIALQQDGRGVIADMQDHGVVVLGLEADGPVSWRKENIHFRSA